MSTAAEAIALLQKKASKIVDLIISGETVAMPIRRLSPRVFFDIYGGIFAKLPDANGKDAREKVRLLSEEADAISGGGKKDPALWTENIRAAEATVRYACITELGSDERLFDDDADLSIFSIEELTEAAEKILAFSGVTQEAGETARRFRDKS